MGSFASRAPSVRLRLTVLATALAALVLVPSAVGLVLLQRVQLTANLDHSLEQRADAVAATLAGPRPGEAFVNSNDEDRAAQLVGPGGRVLGATDNLAGAPALPETPSRDGRPSIDTMRIPGLEDDTYRVLTSRVDLPDGTGVLHLGENSDDLDDSIRWLAAALAAAVPLAIGLLAVLMWWLVGRTLRPVEAIRAEVAEISGSDLHRRVPVPPQDDEIARLAATMNAMLERIAAGADRQRRFVADASHELRTPLTRIRTELEVDRARPELADPTATSAAVLSETVSLQHLIDDLLLLARSDAGMQPLASSRVDLDDLVLAEACREVDRPGVDLEVGDVSAAQVHGDAEQLRRMVRNLLDNALRHARSTVWVSLREGPQGAELVVADDGPGIPPTERDRVFERFARVDAARAGPGGGTGLGLAIVRDIVERHRGTVRCEDAEPGARLVVVLPCVPA